ncbi:MAG: cysteine desulfurase family protein [Gammaproteobacteria bacterium]|nr:cysteine desulfurase family protein [Gammaproteobacteria bacterium]MYA36151.1 cysteine desulfurase [Gammaproteobacteria bacterium]MYH85866.1 cysteine desulfurase [Gammaproteobacteria bacterium]MYK05687.1 cysteine desulfurase [Gammaproteobacteria bacterium]
MKTTTNIFLDHQATTPLDDRVLEVMLPWLRRPANPHSVEHAFGQDAAAAIEHARTQVAEAVNGDPDGVVFTASATEAANIVIRSFANGGNRLLISAIEHPCVRETAKECMKEARAVVVTAPVNEDGVVDLDALSELIVNMDLVSIMAVNNEVGTIQPIEDIGALCVSEGVPLHSDVAQAIGRVQVDMSAGIAFATLSSHKIYGPPGIGAICAQPEEISHLKPLMSGGGQEGGLRPGTLPTPLCVGFGEACALAVREREQDEKHAAALADLFLENLDKAGVSYAINGSCEERVNQNLNISFDGVVAEALLAQLPTLALSTGSACSSGSISQSEVLTAMGLAEDRVESAVRVGFGRGTKPDEVLDAAASVTAAVTRLKGQCV